MYVQLCRGVWKELNTCECGVMGNNQQQSSVMQDDVEPSVNALKSAFSSVLFLSHNSSLTTTSFVLTLETPSIDIQ